jgi:hypothetical protein
VSIVILHSRDRSRHRNSLIIVFSGFLPKRAAAKAAARGRILLFLQEIISGGQGESRRNPRFLVPSSVKNSKKKAALWARHGFALQSLNKLLLLK